MRLGVVDEGHDALVIKAVGGDVIVANHGFRIDEGGDLLLALVVSTVEYVLGVDEIVEDGEDVGAVRGQDKIRL